LSLVYYYFSYWPCSDLSIGQWEQQTYAKFCIEASRKWTTKSTDRIMMAGGKHSNRSSVKLVWIWILLSWYRFEPSCMLFFCHAYRLIVLKK
jgi:hypothetical protein